MKRTRFVNTRERLLDAAEAVVIEHGVSAMTLDAVAARAKVSKGGLLYHFPSKDAIVLGIVSRMISIVQQRFASELASEAPGRGRHARTLLGVMMDTGPNAPFPKVQRIAGPLRASVANNPEMLEPVRHFLKTVYQGMLDDGLSPERCWLVLAAIGGLNFWRIFEVLRPSRQDLAGLRHLLTQIVEEA